MAEEICVKSSGLTLASLMSECEQSEFDKAGFLLGDYSEEIIKSVTDAEIETIKIKKMLNITGIFPISDIFFNHIGEIDFKNKNIEYIRCQKNLIGWYRSRRNTSLIMTLREKLIHKELLSIADKPELFTFCVLTSSYTKNCATHTYSQVFYRYDYTQFTEIPLIITNLSDADKLYKTTSQKSGTIDKIIRNIRSDINVNSDLSLNKIEDSVQEHVNSLISQVSKLYEEKKRLQIELQQFKKQDNCESDDSLKEILTKASDEIKDKFNYANALKNNSPIVNKETKKALNAQLKMTPDSSITKDLAKNKSKVKNTTPSPSHITVRTRSNKKNLQLNSSKELNNGVALLQDKED